MYKVLVYFKDLQDGEKAYNVGDVFPHEGVKKARLKELASDKNRRGIPLIEFIPEEQDEAITE